jgi:hypothetical protein
MPFPSKFGKYAKKGLRKRYMYKNKRGKSRVKFNKVVRDLAYIKSSLNTERKFVQTEINTTPTNVSPSLIALDVPDTQGTLMNQRVGAKVRFTHMSGKFIINKKNFGDNQNSVTIKMYLIWLKNGEDASNFDVSRIMNPDVENNFSVSSYWNKNAYGSWYAVHKYFRTIRDVGNLSNFVNPDINTDANNDLLGSRISGELKVYHQFNKKCNIVQTYPNPYNDDPTHTPDLVLRHKPYLLILTDAKGGSTPSGIAPPTGYNGDLVNVKAQIRLTYVDN